MKRGNFKIETNVGHAMSHDSTEKHAPFFSSLHVEIKNSPNFLILLRSMEEEKSEMKSGSRVYSSCTRVWSHQRVYAERVSIRDFTGSKAPSGSIVIPLCRLSLSLSLLWGATKKTKEEDETKPLYGWPFPPVMGNVEAAQRHAAKIYSAPRASAYRSRSTSVRSLNFVLSTRSGMKSREAFFTNRSKREI